MRAGSVKRIGSAVGQGAVAVAAVSQYLDTLEDDGLGDLPPLVTPPFGELPYGEPPFTTDSLETTGSFETTGPFEATGLDGGIPGQGLLGDGEDLLGEEIDED